jgi:hypothetical protein
MSSGILSTVQNAFRVPRGESPLLPVAVLNPNGIPSLTPGLRAGRYPGSTSQTRPNPERVASHPRRALAQRFNPFRVDDSFSRPPRVAPTSQPWAEGCNPVGIGGAHAPSRVLNGALAGQREAWTILNALFESSVLLCSARARNTAREAHALPLTLQLL